MIILTVAIKFSSPNLCVAETQWRDCSWSSTSSDLPCDSTQSWTWTTTISCTTRRCRRPPWTSGCSCSCGARRPRPLPSRRPPRSSSPCRTWAARRRPPPPSPPLARRQRRPVPPPLRPSCTHFWPRRPPPPATTATGPVACRTCRRTYGRSGRRCTAPRTTTCKRWRRGQRGRPTFASPDLCFPCTNDTAPTWFLPSPARRSPRRRRHPPCRSPPPGLPPPPTRHLLLENSSDFCMDLEVILFCESVWWATREKRTVFSIDILIIGHNLFRNSKWILKF